MIHSRQISEIHDGFLEDDSLTETVWADVEPRTDASIPPAAPSATGADRRGRWAHVYAAIDLGTNNCRLLVARPAKGGVRVVDAFSRIVRLGEGLTRTGALSDAAMDRAVDALTICARKMQRRGVTRARHVATQACRTAHNSDEFIDRVKSATGLTLELIAPEFEAKLAVAGCLPLLDPSVPHALIFDIGGGSTEIIWLHRRHNRPGFDIAAWTSLPIGVVTLAERHSGHLIDGDHYPAMIREVEDMVAPFAARHRGSFPDPKGGRLQVLGTSGTVTTLAGVHLGLPRYDRTKVDGSYMSLEDVGAVSHRLAAMNFAERATIPCVGQDRADLVVAGCAILEAINNTWPAPRICVADRGLREGILAGLMEDADREAGRVRRDLPFARMP